VSFTRHLLQVTSDGRSLCILSVHPHVGFDFYPYIFVWISAILVVRPSMSPCYIPPTLYPPESRVVWIADRHQRRAEVQHGLNSSAVRPLSEISRRVWEYWVDPRQY
jgi:hypothetical protein